MSSQENPNANITTNVPAPAVNLENDTGGSIIGDPSLGLQSLMDTTFIERIPIVIDQYIERTRAIEHMYYIVSLYLHLLTDCLVFFLGPTGPSSSSTDNRQSSSSSTVVRTTSGARPTTAQDARALLLSHLPATAGTQSGLVARSKMNPLTHGMNGQAMQHCDSAVTAHVLFAEKLQAGLVNVAPGAETVNFTLGPSEGELFP
ncbi:hypothetical protein E1B28_002186 [Marasmius oreades]|uniref:Uncharacterized protein n=1 Tax=Marasmius oreades TaxID=181124 RepID=A0A9P7RMI7_9AGAR|nr:uncharacterized protein E1B28_002186 [Marasmius oreades]KAG7086220.1 hypothetical protein E1B28_002186 [Marasmius oreades]